MRNYPKKVGTKSHGPGSSQWDGKTRTCREEELICMNNSVTHDNNIDSQPNVNSVKLH